MLLSLVLVLRILALRRAKLAVHLWRCWCVLIAGLWQTLVLQCSSLCLDKCVFDGSHNLWRENRSLVHGSRYRFLPGLEHAFHGSPHVAVDKRVSFHVGAVQTTTEVDSVRCADVLHDGVQNVQRRELLRWCCLVASVSFEINNKSGRLADNGQVFQVSRDDGKVPYRFDVVLESFRDSLSVFGALLGDDGQVADFIAIVLRQIAQRVCKVLGDRGRGGAGN